MIFALCPAVSWAVLLVAVVPVVVGGIIAYRRDQLEDSVRRHVSGGGR